MTKYRTEVIAPTDAQLAGCALAAPPLWDSELPSGTHAKLTAMQSRVNDVVSALAKQYELVNQCNIRLRNTREWVKAQQKNAKE